jgi:hypothetical protein
MIEVNQEIRNRIRLSVAAYAYEYDNNSIMSDAEFDELSKKINPNEATGYVKLDEFFQKEFHPDTGMWIRNHPDINGIKRIYEDFYKSGDM